MMRGYGDRKRSYSEVADLFNEDFPNRINPMTRFTEPQDHNIQPENIEDSSPIREIPSGSGGEDDHFHQANDRSRLQRLQAELEEHLSHDGEGAIPGEPEQDYPVFSQVPQTSFSCAGRHAPGYYADIESRCQAFHICDSGGTKHSFLCPGGSVFNQRFLVCDWWYGFTCQDAPDLFEDQREIYKVFQRENNNNNLISQHIDFQPNEQYVADIDQSSFILLQNEVFQGAESGIPNRDKLENYRRQDNQNKDVKHFKEVNEVATSQTASTNLTNRSSNVEQEKVQKPIKSIVRKKQHNQFNAQKAHNLQYIPNDSGDSKVQTANGHKEETSLDISFEHLHSNLNQPFT